MSTLSLNDLRFLYYGGGTEAEMQFLEDAYANGISAEDVLGVVISGGGGGTGTPVATKDEGVTIQANTSTINFVGAGVTATSGGLNTTTVTVPGSAGGPPSGSAGGSLAGTYPSPSIAAGAIGPTELALGAVNSSLKIGNNAVDDTKLVDIPTATVKGRVLGGTGDPANLTQTELTSLVNGFTPTLKGSVPPPVTPAGNFLKDDGTWAVPYTPPVGNLSMFVTNTEQTANYNAAPNEFVLFNTTTGARTMFLPPAPPNGTLCGCRITTFGAGNFVTTVCGGTDVFTKAGASGTQATVLQYNGQGIVYEYQAGVWQPIMSNHSLFGLDSRYVQTANLVTLNPGLDLEMSAVVGGVQTVGVTPAQHAFWQPQSIVAATDQGPIQSNQAVFADAALVLPVVANASYEMKLHLVYDSTPGNSPAANFRCAFTVPAGSTLQWCLPAAPHTSWTGTGVALQFGPYQLSAGGAGAVIGCCALGTATLVEAMGTLVVGGTAGNLQFQWAQGLSQATNTTRKAGSTLILRRFA